MIYLASPYSHSDANIREQRFLDVCRMTVTARYKRSATRQLSLSIQLVSNHNVSKCGGRSREPARRDTSDNFEIVTSAHWLR